MAVPTTDRDVSFRHFVTMEKKIAFGGKDRTAQSDGRVHGVIVGCQREDARWLLIRRSTSVASPLRVCFPGGAIDGNESQHEAAVREMHEELSILVQPTACVWHSVFPDMPLTLWGWHAELGTAEIVPDPTEVAEVLWLTPDEIVQHPETLPGTDIFLASLLRHV
jgi:8-oxo-dGTP diphosphatase